MRKETIQAFSGHGEAKIMVGEEVIEVGETLTEASELAGGDDKVLDSHNRQLLTDAKNRLRAAPTGGARAKSIYDKCCKAGCEEAQAREISGFTG